MRVIPANWKSHELSGIRLGNRKIASETRFIVRRISKPAHGCGQDKRTLDYSRAANLHLRKPGIKQPLRESVITSTPGDLGEINELMSGSICVLDGLQPFEPCPCTIAREQTQ